MTNKKWIGFGIVLLALLITLSAYPFTIGMVGVPNPAAVYCDEMGGKLADNMCKFKDVECNQWDFYEGKCGQEHNHCRTFGSFTASVGCKYSSECAECYVICITGECADIEGTQSWEIVDEALGIKECKDYTYRLCPDRCVKDELLGCADSPYEWECWSVNKEATGCIYGNSFSSCAAELPCPPLCRSLEECEQYIDCAEEGEIVYDYATKGPTECCNGLVFVPCEGLCTPSILGHCEKPVEDDTIIDEVIGTIENSDVTALIAEKTGLSTATTSKLIIAYFIITNIFLIVLLVRYFKRKK